MKVSVIIPVYNAEKFLKKSMDNYLEQSYEDIEFILIDDGSKDTSGEICDDFSKKYKNVSAYHQQNQGVSAARNLGIIKSNGEYISFLDADDFIDSCMIRDMILVAEDKNIDMVSCGLSMEIEKKDGTLSKQSDIYYSDTIEVIEGQDSITKNLLNIWENAVPYNVVNKLYRKKLLLDNNIKFSELKMGEDLEFNMHVLKVCNNIALLPKCYYKYIRQREGAATVRYISNWYEIREEEYFRMMSYFKNIFNLGEIPNDIQEYTSRRFVNRALGCLENEFRGEHDNKYNNIRKIVYSDVFQRAIRCGKRYSLKIKIMLIPIRMRWVRITYIMGFMLNLARDKFPYLFEYLKYRR